MSHITTYHTDTGELIIEFDHQRREPATLEYPGCEESVTITSVQSFGVEVIDQCSDKLIKVLMEKCWEELANAEQSA
jgi:hypothetical protein